MKKALATFALVAVATVLARADIELAWDVSGHGTPADTTLAASTVNANLNTGGALNALGRNTVVGVNTANAFNSNNWNITATADLSTRYIGFSLNPNTAITLSSLQFAINGSNSAPGMGEWGYSINGGAFVTQTPFSITSLTPVLTTWDFSDFNITSSDTVEFRFQAFGTVSINGGASSGAGTVRIFNIAGNDLILNGATIPEPTTFALIGLGLAGVAAFARRRALKS